MFYMYGDYILMGKNGGIELHKTEYEQFDLLDRVNDGNVDADVARYMRIIHILSNNISDLYGVNVKTGGLTVFRQAGEAVGVNEKINMGAHYDVAISTYIDNNVYHEDREEMRRALSFYNVCELLKKNESFIYRYRVFRNNTICHFHLKCARIGDGDNFEEIIYAFASDEEDIKREILQQSIATGTGKQRRKVLVIEDNDINRAMLREILEPTYEVIEACDGDEGLEILRGRYRELSVVLLDLVMPNKTGLEVLEIVKDSPSLSSVPIIVITSSNRDEQEAKCLDLGAVDVLPKPYNPVIVMSRIRNIIRMRESASLVGNIEHDELTGIYTRQAFYQHALALLDANPGIEFDMTIADVQSFKLINSIYGEAKGDEVLRYMASFFETNTLNGICARYGGDQFVGIAPAAQDRKRDWLLEMASELEKNCPIPNVTVKYGVYTNVDRELTVSGMCDRALLAVKSIKHNFEVVYTKYDGPVSQRRQRDQLFESRFEEALKTGEFYPWFQPKFDAVTGKLVGAEALVRWIMKDGTFVSPGEFIPTFEEDGLIVRLDEYMFRNVCTKVKMWMDRGYQLLPISINLSRLSLHREGTVERYKKIAEEIGVPTKYLPLELTESAALHSIQIKNFTDALKESGFQLHMDDFGAGISSLASLNILPFDVVKLDKSLVDFIGDAGGDEMLKHIIELAHFKNMKVVAEGVEQAEQLEFLRQINCDIIQGYYYCPPLGYERFLQFLQRCIEEDNVLFE